MGGNPPSADQWKAIKEKLKKVEVVKPTVFRDERPRASWLESPGPLVARYS